VDAAEAVGKRGSVTPPKAEATRLHATMNGPSDGDRLSAAVIAGGAYANVVQSKPSRPQPSPDATKARRLCVASSCLPTVGPATEAAGRAA
jgi:hypothetical protein